MNKRIFVSAATLAAVLAAISGSRAETLGPVTDALGVVKIAKGQPIVIGGYSSQSGGDTNQGIDELRGAEIAIKDAGGQVLGFPVKLIEEDAQCTAEAGQTAAIKLAGNKQIVAVVGPSCSSGARAGAPILWKLGIPSVGIGATAPALTAADRPEGFQGYLRVVPNDLKSAAFTADYVWDKLGLKSAATIHDGSPYTEQLVRAFEKDFAAKGGAIVSSEAVSPTDTDLRPVLTRIATRKPQLIFSPVFTSTIGFLMRQKDEVPGLSGTKVIGGEGVFSANVIEAVGPKIVGFNIVGPSTDLFSTRFPTFVKAFTAEYGEAPTGGFSAYGYDAALLTMTAIKAAAKTDADGNLYVGRQALHDAMMATRDLPGLTGSLTCDPHGDCAAATYAIWEFTSDDQSSFAPGTNPKTDLSMSEAVRSAREPGALAEWLRRSTWVDHVLLAIRAGVAVLLLAGLAGGLTAGTYSAADFVSFAVFGLTMGSIYALIALGYTMVYGILRMINFAHGDVMMVGSFAGLFAAGGLNDLGLLSALPLLALPLVLAAGMAAGAVVSLGVERVAYRPFLHVRSLAPLICAIGLSFVLQYTARGLFGTRNRAYPGFGWMEGTLDLFGLTMPIPQVVAFVAALIVLAGLLVVVRLSPLGKAMRAVSEDRDAAALVGIDVGRVIVATFAIGGAMAGVAGVLYALVFKQITVFMGFSLGVKGFAAAILGGIGNLGGALLGGLVLGLAEALGPALVLEGFHIPAPYQLKDVIGYGMLVMILIFRPQGLLGERLASKRA